MWVSLDGGPVEGPSCDGPVAHLLALSAGLNVLLRLEASPFGVKRKTVMSIFIHHDKFFVFRTERVSLFS